MPLPTDKENTKVELGPIPSSLDVVISTADKIVNEFKTVVALTADEIITKFQDSTDKLFLQAVRIRDAALKLQNLAQIDLEIEKVEKFNERYWRLFNLCDEKLKPFEPLSTTQEEKFAKCITRPEATRFVDYFLKPLFDRNQELLANEREKMIQKQADDRIKMQEFYRKHGLLKPPSSSARPSAISTELNQQNLANSCVLL